MVNKTLSHLKLDLLENVFIIYETCTKYCHDLIISPPIWINLLIVFLPKKAFVSS